WVGKVFRREDLYQGPLVKDAPDIAFLPTDMRHLPLGNADFASNRFMVDAFGISGCHRMNGVMIANGEAIRRGAKLKQAQIYDMAPTLLYLMNQAVTADMDGRVLREAILESYLSAVPVRLSADHQSDSSVEMEFSLEENADVLERLKLLGYIG